MRREDTLIYGFTELQTTNLMVGFKMVMGVQYEATMHCDETERSLFRVLVGSHRSTSEQVLRGRSLGASIVIRESSEPVKECCPHPESLTEKASNVFGLLFTTGT